MKRLWEVRIPFPTDGIHNLTQRVLATQATVVESRELILVSAMSTIYSPLVYRLLSEQHTLHSTRWITSPLLI
jgi:hypothetical protein